jgi:hypothetical protein
MRWPRWVTKGKGELLDFAPTLETFDAQANNRRLHMLARL